MSSQYTFSLPPTATYREEDFLVSDANREAHAWITRWPDWPAHALILIGPAASGKTHLAHIWQTRAHTGDVIEAFDTQNAEDLLHRINYAKEQKRFLLLTSTTPNWPFTLPDLTSRLKALPLTTLHAPDDTLLAAVLTKHFADRQLSVAPEVIAYIIPRIERSFEAARTVAETLDKKALEQGKAVTLKSVREILAS